MLNAQSRVTGGADNCKKTTLAQVIGFTKKGVIKDRGIAAFSKAQSRAKLRRNQEPPMKSILATIDIETGMETVLYETDRHLEAPNWTPDGAALIVNGGGRLYRFPLDNPALIEIDTGFAKALNNDHGLSPDGAMLAVSDGTETGESRIYTLPVIGGVPRRITSQTPSYWHGWSPDGETLAYVGKRPETGDTFQVFTIGLNSGAEKQVTRDFDHCDGPDYTPDGKWIWFNGERSGSVQLWRISRTAATCSR